MAKTIFKKGDFVLPEGENGVLENGGCLPSRIIKNVFGDGPLPVKLTFEVECTCGSKPHLSACAISLNSGHTQILVLACSDFSQMQCSGAHMKIVSR